MINVEKVKPTGLFTNYIYKAIPLAFDESMSYYETLCGLLSYLKDTVIPALNNNADAIAEVQELMTQLQNFVDNYFDNLDVQEEINTKLDEMAESGVLEEIMADYLDTRAVFGFDTVADMKVATNLTNGSFARTLGYSNKNDGEGAIYKIRPITNEDIVNEINIIAVDDVTLIAELIIEKEEKCFNTVADMKSSKSIWNGSCAKTLGYHSANDEGGAEYKIRLKTNEDVVDEGSIIAIGTSLVAELIYDNEINVKQFGAYGDGVHDDATVINNAIQKAPIINFSTGTYRLMSSLVLENNSYLNGNGSILTTDTVVDREDSIIGITANNKNNLKISNFTINKCFKAIVIDNSTKIEIEKITVSSLQWGITLRLSNNFNIHDIYFNQERTELWSNKDGVHINGGKYGVIRNIYGTTDDDMIALNADEPDTTWGEISNIIVDNVRTISNNTYVGKDGTYRGIKLLSYGSTIDNITIKNCNIMSDYEQVMYIQGDENANIKNVVIDNCNFIKNHNRNGDIIKCDTPIEDFKMLNSNLTYNTASGTGTFLYFVSNYNRKKLLIDNCKFIDNYNTSKSFITLEGTFDDISINNIITSQVSENRTNHIVAIINTVKNVVLSNIISNVCEAICYIRTGASVTNLLMNNIETDLNRCILLLIGQLANFNLSNVVAKNASYITKVETNQTSLAISYDNIITNVIQTLGAGSTNTNIRLIHGVICSFTPTIASLGDTYFYTLSGEATGDVKMKLYANGSWVELNS